MLQNGPADTRIMKTSRVGRNELGSSFYLLHGTSRTFPDRIGELLIV